jgi:hypothetical protein
MHPNPFTSSGGRREATTKPATASVPFRAADHLRNAREITGYIRAMLTDGDARAIPIALRTVADALYAFDLPPVRCDASTDPRPAAGSIEPIIVYLL